MNLKNCVLSSIALSLNFIVESYIFYIPTELTKIFISLEERRTQTKNRYNILSFDHGFLHAKCQARSATGILFYRVVCVKSPIYSIRTNWDATQSFSSPMNFHRTRMHFLIRLLTDIKNQGDYLMNNY